MVRSGETKTVAIEALPGVIDHRLRPSGDADAPA